MKQDRFLLGILIFIGILVVAAVGIFLVREQVPAYGPEDTPEGIINNYILALQLRDYERAYRYLVEKENKPNFDAFRQVFLTRQLDISPTNIQIGKTETMDSGEAWVEVTVINTASGLFQEGWPSSETAILVQQNGAWRIVSMPYPYWWWDWYQTPVSK